MNCAAATDWLLSADDRAVAPAEVRAHLGGCAACRNVAERLRRIEESYRETPLPAPAGAARVSFLNRLATPAAPPSRFALPPRWVLAASVLFLLGAAAAFFWPTQQARAAPDLVDRLIEWNLDLADAGPAERGRRYDERSDAFAEELRTAGLAADDRQLVESLVANAAWLGANDDPIEEAERLGGMADQMLERLRDSTDNPAVAARFAKRYDRLTERGVAPGIERAKKAQSKPDHPRRLEKQAARAAERERALEELLATTPDATKKEIRQALGPGKPAKKPKKVGQAAGE